MPKQIVGAHRLPAKLGRALTAAGAGLGGGGARGRIESFTLRL